MNPFALYLVMPVAMTTNWPWQQKWINPTFVHITRSCCFLNWQPGARECKRVTALTLEFSSLFECVLARVKSVSISILMSLCPVTGLVIECATTGVDLGQLRGSRVAKSTCRAKCSDFYVQVHLLSSTKTPILYMSFLPDGHTFLGILSSHWNLCSCSWESVT